MRTRNYNFKWWHGVLGLIGLSMVLGAVNTARAASLDPGTPSSRSTKLSYRDYWIDVVPQGQGYRWSVSATPNYRREYEIVYGPSSTLDEAVADAQQAIDDHIGGR